MTAEQITDPLARAHAATNQCCGDDQWRGHLCTFHQGYEDGADAAVVALREAGLLNEMVRVGWRAKNGDLIPMTTAMRQVTLMELERDPSLVALWVARSDLPEEGTR